MRGPTERVGNTVQNGWNISRTSATLVAAQTGGTLWVTNRCLDFNNLLFVLLIGNTVPRGPRGTFADHGQGNRASLILLILIINLVAQDVD